MRGHKSFSLSLANRYSQIVLEAISRTPQLEFEKLKQRLFEASLNPHEVSVEGICESLKNIANLYYEPLVEGLKSLGYCIIDVEAATRSKLVVGISSGVFSSIFEVGLSWNYILDLPFIPSSSLKGAMKSLMTHKCTSLDSKNSRRECLSLVASLMGASGSFFVKDEVEWVLEVFGSEKPVAEPAWSGRVFVADAFPVEKGLGRTGCGILDFDVLTPHYYKGGEVVGDEFGAEPTPIPHLVVAPSVKFRFVVAVDKMSEEMLSKLSKYFSAGNECQLLLKILLDTLREGVGARTTKGYGSFEVSRARVIREVRATRKRKQSLSLKWM